MRGPRYLTNGTLLFPTADDHSCPAPVVRRRPAVYCLYGGRDRRHAAYVGIADKLRTRIDQHLVRRDRSVTTGVATVTLNSDLVTEIKWWRHPTFVVIETLSKPRSLSPFRCWILFCVV